MRAFIFKTAESSSVLRIDTYDSYNDDFDALALIDHQSKTGGKKNTLKLQQDPFEVFKYNYPTHEQQELDPECQQTFVSGAMTRPGLH